MGFGAYLDHAASDGIPEQATAALESELVRESASPDVRYAAKWIVATKDHAAMPFVVIDKADARIYVFDSRGRLRGGAPVLLGAKRSDEAAPSATPAGRFVANTASVGTGGIVWANGKTQLALEALAAEHAGELRPLESTSAQDRRVSAGVLQVDASFFRDRLDALRTQPSVAYVLPETVPVEQVFGNQGTPAALMVTRSPS